MKRVSLVMLLAIVARTASAAEAAAMYEEIYKVTLEPVLLYNIAQAHRLGGDFEKAVSFYKGYVRAQPQAKNRSAPVTSATGANGLDLWNIGAVPVDTAGAVAAGVTCPSGHIQ